MNIYDFAGNEFEWTLEHATSRSDYPCACRGGDYDPTGSGSPASNRNNYGTTNAGNYIGFRTTLYIN